MKFEKMSVAGIARWAPGGPMRQWCLRRQARQFEQKHLQRLCRVLRRVYRRHEATECAARQLRGVQRVLQARATSLAHWNARGRYKRYCWSLEGRFRRALCKQKNRQASELQRLVAAARRIANQQKAGVQRVLAHRLRKRFEKSVVGQVTAGKMQDLIGCSLVQLRLRLEAQFLPGMTWENRGYYGWHIDHIRPISSFDLRDPEERRKCFHYTNLQPLWASDNLCKSKKWLDPVSQG